MAFLINRAQAGKVQCLHSLCKLIEKQFGTSKQFELSDVKYDPTSKINIHSTCDLILTHPALGIKYCRYKESPLDPSGCGITNGKTADSTKSKEISNTINSLHALNLVTRNANNKVILTSLGKKFANTPYNSPIMHDIIREAVLSYGPMIGLLAQVLNLKKTNFDTSELEVGYSLTKETVNYNGENIILSSGSEDDSNVRTKSCLIAWGITAGFFKPEALASYKYTKAHIAASDYLLGKTRSLRKLEVLDIPDIFNKSFVVKRPLNYTNLTKKSEALRENNQQDVRAATLKFSSVIKNRRFAILYLLNNSFKNKTTLSFTDLGGFFKSNPDLFVINSHELLRIIKVEIKVGFTAGLPFVINKDQILPMNSVDLTELSQGVPQEVLLALNKYIQGQ